MALKNAILNVGKQGGKKMPMFGMLVLSWAVVTYYQISVSAILPLVLMSFIWFIVGWKHGRKYERGVIDG